MRYLSILLLFFSSYLFCQQGFQVDVNTYTHNQLVQQILLQENCSVENLQNITSFGAHVTQGYQSIGYFTNDNSIIPFESGIILSTGNAQRAEGPNNVVLSYGNDTSWQGDTQLFNYIESLNIDPGIDTYKNATSIEFEFTPITNFLSFDYIFLSEEYGQYQCRFSDAFAFFLTDLQTNETTNLAIVPGTDDPVSVITIRDEQYFIATGNETNCGSSNEQYFNNYYQEGALPLSQSPHNFNGDTKVLTASASVIPGRSYAIKLVIADRKDGESDSAVLLKQGSFGSLSLELGDDKYVCQETLLEAPQYSNATYQWTFNNQVISGANSNTLLANQTGEYGLSISLSSQTCTVSDTINITIIGDINVNTIPAYNYQQGEVVNLETFIPQLVADTNGLNITFYESQQNAEQGTNPINNPQNYQINGNTIWVRVESENNSNCFATTSIEMVLNSGEEITVCDNDFDGIYTFNFNALLQRLEQQYGTANSQDIVYIANSDRGLSMIENVSTSPNFVHLCDTNFRAYEVAVDQNQDVYLSSRDDIYKVDLDNCTFQNVGALPDNSRGAMSFDTQNNLYVGSFNHSKVYRANAGQFNNFYLWKDFDNGNSGGDFVVIGSYMYIAWVENGNDVLYRAELGANNEYISHINLGQIQTNTYGLAAENGKLYGVTPDFLYEIDLNTMNTNVVLNRTGSSRWWGAAGLHESSGSTISFHETEADAQSGQNEIGTTYTNTTPFEQTIYIRVLNQATGNIIVIPLKLTVNTSPQTTVGVLNECQGGTNPSYDLEDAIPQMLSDTNGITIAYYTSQQDAENANNPISNPQGYTPTSVPETVYVTFDNGVCPPSINTITLNVYNASLNIQTSHQICAGESVVLDAGSTFSSYQWTGLQGDDIANNNATSSSITVTNPGTYQIEVTYGNNCTITEDIVVTQETPPVFQDVSYNEICSNNTSEEVSITTLLDKLNQINSSLYYELYLTTNDAESGTNVLSGSQQVNDGQQLIIKVKNNASSTCYSLNTLTIDFIENPSVNIEEQYSICEGETLTLSLDASLSYTWTGFQGQDIANNNVNGNQVNLTQEGMYTVEVSNGNCNVSYTFEVKYNQSAMILSVEVEGNNITIISNGTSTAQYSINGQDWFASSYFSNLENGVYTAYLKDENLCGTSNMDFVIFEINNVITPNGDGVNDVWKIVGLVNYPDSMITIYDRYGKVILNQKVASDFYWDGTYHGQLLPSTDYWYVIQVQDGRVFSGHITIKTH